ncbi:hypothetical protein ACHAQA_003496 [Verticillium albo-atrum]
MATAESITATEGAPSPRQMTLEELVTGEAKKTGAHTRRQRLSEWLTNISPAVSSPARSLQRQNPRDVGEQRQGRRGKAKGESFTRAFISSVRRSPKAERDAQPAEGDSSIQQEAQPTSIRRSMSATSLISALSRRSATSFLTNRSHKSCGSQISYDDPILNTIETMQSLVKKMLASVETPKASTKSVPQNPGAELVRVLAKIDAHLMRLVGDRAIRQSQVDTAPFELIKLCDQLKIYVWMVGGKVTPDVLAAAIIDMNATYKALVEWSDAFTNESSIKAREDARQAEGGRRRGPSSPLDPNVMKLLRRFELKDVSEASAVDGAGDGAKERVPSDVERRAPEPHK